jgi:hypothetical protein
LNLRPIFPFFGGYEWIKASDVGSSCVAEQEEKAFLVKNVVRIQMKEILFFVLLVKTKEKVFFSSSFLRDRKKQKVVIIGVIVHSKLNLPSA